MENLDTPSVYGRMLALAGRTAVTFSFPAEVDSWHDGDTVYVHRAARPGLVIHGEHVRVEGINAPELHDVNGYAARDYAASLAPPGTIVLLRCTHLDKYGRLLARVILPNGLDLSDEMIKAGLAVAFMV